MANDEEYLDNLLKSLTESEAQSSNREDAESLNNAEAETFKVTTDDGDDIQKITEPELDLEQLEEVTMEEPELDLEQLEEVTMEEPYLELEQLEEVIKEEPDLDLEELDVTDFIDNLESNDDDLAEINGLLKKSDNNESIDDDMLALLEGAEGNIEENLFDADNEAFDIFAEVQEEELQLSDVNIQKENAVKTKRKKKEKRKKNNKNIESDNKDAAEEISENADQIKEKKPGFFARLIKSLTEEENFTVEGVDENEKILKELDEEDRKKEAKANKKSKKDTKKKTKGKASKASEAEDGEIEEENQDNPKKKPKKEKKVKEKKVNTEKVITVKVLTKRKLLVLIIFCISIIAGITAMSIFFSDYADKKNAREAYYNKEYEEVYTLLYDKNLEDGDLLMFNKVKTVMKIERKLRSYQNYLLMEKPVEALDALLRGVLLYSEFTDADTYEVRAEVDVVYTQICAELNDNFNISEGEAQEINEYNNETYTQKLNSVVFGTEFIMPGQIEEAETDVPQDILSEEEDIIDL